MSLNRKPESSNTAFWDKLRGTIRSKKGGWIPGEKVHCCGYDMMEDLVGKASYFQTLVLNVTGRLPERRLADFLEAYFIGNSYPDARIWCNQIGSLAGTMDASPVVASTAGVLASDSTLYGPGTIYGGIAFIVSALKKKRQGMSPEEIVRSCQRNPKAKPVIIGYVRPVAKGDERIPALERHRKELGIERGEHLSLAFQIAAEMEKIAKETMNLLGYIAPFLCDQGFSPKEAYRIVSTRVYSGVLACYAEAADQPGESFFPLQCNDIDYQGHSQRAVPVPTKT